MADQNFPFMFDAAKVKELFAGVKLPGVDADAMLAAQQKNVDALIEANKVVVSGYQELYKRQTALFEAAVAQIKEKMSEVKAQPMTVEQANQNVEALRASFEKAAADMRELAELAQKANTGAFEIVKTRAEEAIAEFKAAVEKVSA